MQYSAKLLVAALFALSPAVHPDVRAVALAQVAQVTQTPVFSLPETVPSGATLSVQSSPNLGGAVEALQQDFEAAYEGTTVGVEIASSDDALKALVDNEADLAAIGRPLTQAEQAEGLTTVPLERAKIAVIIGPDNPFTGNLTFAQFAAIFRGEITDWSQVGGPPGPIRFVDRPEISDTRRSLSQYDVFLSAPFETGATADPVAEDDTAVVIQALGRDGISYAIAPHVLDQPGVKIVPMHQTLPDDPRYPYSQPRYFVYKGEPSPAVAAFLGYATAPAGLAVIAAANGAEVEAIADAIASPAPTPTATPGAAATPVPAVPVDPAVAPVPAETGARGGFAWWWLLPLAALLGGLGWLLTRGRGAAPIAAAPIAPPPPIEPPVVPPVAVTPPAVVPPVVPPVVMEPPTAEVIPEPVVVPPEPGIITVEEVSPPVAPVVEPPEPPPVPLPAIAMGLGAAGLAAGVAASLASTEDQTAVEASKFNVVGHPADGDLDLSTLDDGLPPLPDGYGDSRIVLMARDPQWAYAYWDTPDSHKAELRRQGGEHLALRLYDVTGINLDDKAPHSLQQFSCDELAREWYMQIPVSDRDYQVEIGYLAGNGRWLVLARSNTIRIPPVYPSNWTEEHFLTVTWDENLRGKTIMTLADPFHPDAGAGLHEQLYALAQEGEALRIDGSLFGSMPHVAGSMAPPVSSFIFPSGAGLGAAAMVPGLTMSGVSGLTMSGVGLSGLTMSGAGLSGLTMSGMGLSGLTMSGMGLSGLTMSGVGFGASMPPLRPRQFWLVADAELIVYGATEPDATVTIAGNPIQLTEEGTFRFQISFQDGTVEYPIMAVAADGEQSRNVHMTFERQTPSRNTNTKEEAQDEWPSV
jgi:ABC-type phosphate transport system substrate-binding protein